MCSWDGFLHLLEERIRLLRIKDLITSHDSNQIFRVRQIDDIVSPARDHVNCFDLIPAYFKLHHLSSVNISLLDQAMVCLFYSWDTELSTGHSILIFRGP